MDETRPRRPYEKPTLKAKSAEEMLDMLKNGSPYLNNRTDTATEKEEKIVCEKLLFDTMDDFTDHPFSLYSGERKNDMVESIRNNGIMQPLIVRYVEETQRYQILAGHNRKYAAIDAGLTDAVAIIKHNLSDEDALAYVIESNLMQRSFSEMKHSEKAAVLSFEHSKLFSQGKRNDIQNELKILEFPQNDGGNSTCAQVGHMLKTREIIGQEYGLSKNTVARYIRIGHLNNFLKDCLDNGDIGFTIAVELSYLKPNEQDLLAKCIELNEFKVDAKKAALMRSFSDRNRLDDEKIYLILNGDLATPKKPRATLVSLKPKFLKAHGLDHMKPTEVEDYIDKAISFYRAYENEMEDAALDEENEPDDEMDMEV